MSESHLTLEHRVALVFWQCGIVDVPAEEVAKIAAEIYERLEDVVGQELASLCDDDQLELYTAILERGDEVAASAWLELNVPFHRLIVQKHVEEQIDMLGERLEVIQ